MASVVVGIDLGGTSVRVGAFGPDGRMYHVMERPIEAARGPQAGLARIGDLVAACVAKAGAGELAGLGIGASGPLDTVKGTINNPYTLPGWADVPILRRLEERFHAPARLENDADASALGEYWMGAGRGVKRLFSVTVGTGVGTAFIYNGEVYRGMDGLHPEGGHLPIDPAGPLCYCGLRGCWESLASGTAIGVFGRQAAAEHPESRMSALAQGDPEKIDGRLVIEAARLGDAAALEVVENAARYMGLGLATILSMFLPEVIVLSGGVMKSIDLFLPVIRATIRQQNVMLPVEKVRIVPASLGYHAGIYGAAFSILQHLRLNE